jgi:Ser/Thr protein kinase RdoA (MazF antagonist)
VRVPARGGRAETLSLVVKELRGAARRESRVYQDLLAGRPDAPAARLLGVQAGARRAYLFLEHVRPWRRWPWRDAAFAGLVLGELARLHAAVPASACPGGWDYEAALRRSARATLVAVTALRSGAPGRAAWPRGAGDLRRVIQALPGIRGRLLAGGADLVHGDVHPGNVVVQAHRRGFRVVLLDWSRCRPGSPLEDVASWLQSLGCWEPEARRRHDTLLRAYLAQRGWPGGLGPELRTAYWLAAACNGLAGAIRYHALVVEAPGTPPAARAASARALGAWHRVIRQAAGCLAGLTGCR